MRMPTVAGIVLACIGVYLLVQGGTFTKKHDVISVGDLKISATEDKAIPSWVGGLVVLAGVAIIVSGQRKGA